MGLHERPTGVRRRPGTVPKSRPSPMDHMVPVLLGGLFFHLAVLRSMPVAIALLIAVASALSARRLWQEVRNVNRHGGVRVASAVHLVVASGLLLKSPLSAATVERLRPPLATFGYDDFVMASALMSVGYIVFDVVTSQRIGRFPMVWRRLVNLARLWITAGGPPSLSLVRWFAAASLASRAILQFGFDVGVIGKTPSYLGSGAVFYAVTTGLQVAVTFLIAVEMASGLPLRRRASLPCSIGYLLLGVLAGTRSTPLQIVLVWLLVGVFFGFRIWRRNFVAASLALVVALSSFGVLTTVFRSPDPSAPQLPGLVAGLRRLGGSDSLAQVVHADVRAGPADLLLSFNETVNTQVYELPIGVKTGFAITLWGFGYIAGGLMGVVLSALLLGVLVQLMDQIVRRFANVAVRSTWTATLWLWVVNITMEGTVWSSAKALLAATVSLIVLTRVGTSLAATRR